MRAGVRVAAIAGVTVVAAGGAYLLGVSSSTQNGERGSAPVVPKPAAQAPGPAVPLTPEAAGAAWLEAVHERDWRDRSSSSHVDRALRYTVGSAADTVRQARSAGDADSDWGEFVARRCTTRVLQPGVVIPPEAPRSAEVVYVQVSGEVTTECELAGGPESAPLPVAATLEARHDGQGWRISAQLF